jgi:hypothetical protein
MNNTKIESVRTCSRIQGLVLVLIFWPVVLFGQNQDDRSTIDIWRDTLRFGIDSSVTAIIGEMQTARNTELIPELREIFPGARRAVQTRIIEFFQAMESAELVPEIIEEMLFFQDLHASLVQLMIRYLQAFPPDQEPELDQVMTEIASGTNPELSSAAIGFLGARKQVESFDYFMDLYEKDGQPIQVRLAALEALGNFPNQQVVDFLEDLAEDSSLDQLLRQSSIRALGKIGNSQSLALFRRLLDTDDPFLRTTVLQSLDSFETREISGLYRSALRDSFWRVRLSVLQALARNPIPELESQVTFIARNDPEVPVRTQGYRTLRAYDSNQAWQVIEADAFNTRISESYRLLLLEMVVQNRFRQNRDRIVEIIDQEWTKENSRLLDVIGRNLSTLNESQALPIFERFLSHREIVIRIYGIRGIGNSAGRQFRDQIEALTQDGNPPVIRQNARAALERL